MQFRKESFTAKFAGEEQGPFDVYGRDMWDWAMSLVANPNISQHMKWDAQQLYKWNGERWVHYVHEPWTGKLWWEIQACICHDLSAAFTYTGIYYYRNRTCFLLMQSRSPSPYTQTRLSFPHSEMLQDTQ